MARLRAGFRLGESIRGVSEPFLHLVGSMESAEQGDQSRIWQEYLDSLEGDEAGRLIDALAAVDPHDPCPSVQPWERPVTTTLPDVLPFPHQVLPRPMARLILEGARSIGCPPDFFGLPALVIAGVAIGCTARLRLKEGYHASASLYAACVGLAGDGKSPALEKVILPMDQVDQELFEEWKVAIEAYERLTQQQSTAAKRSRGGARGRRGAFAGDGSSRTHDLGREFEDEPAEVEGVDEIEDLGSPPRREPPILKRHIVRDSTVEALVSILEQNPRGLLMGLDEASSLAASMNQYKGGRGTDRQYYLSIWSGQPITVDRKGHADLAPLRVPRPFLGITGMLVPAMITEMAEGKGRHDGFLDRFLFAYPDPMPKAGWDDGGISQEAASGWADMLHRLLSRTMASDGMKPVPHLVHLSPEARQAWRALIDGHHAEQNAPDFERWLRGPWAKFDQYAGRLVLILHLLELAGDAERDSSELPDVPSATVRKAGVLLEYLKSHTRRVHAAIRPRADEESGGDEVDAICRWILRHRPDSFSLRDITRDLSRTFGRRSQSLHEAIRGLVERKWIRQQTAADVEGGRPGRKPSPVYEVNPHLYASHNRQNGPLSGSDRHPVDPSVDSVGFAETRPVEDRKEVADERAGS